MFFINQISITYIFFRNLSLIFSSFLWEQNLWFGLFSFVCLVFSLKCVTSKNIIEALYSLVCVFLLVAGILFLIHVEFLAIIFVMVYVGAILVLFLFSIMLLNFRENFSKVWYLDIYFYLSWFSFLFWWIKIENIFLIDIDANWYSNYFSKKEFVNILYTVDSSFADIYIFKFLYLDYSLFLIIIAIILLLSMVGSVSICLGVKTKQTYKKLKI